LHDGAPKSRVSRIAAVRKKCRWHRHYVIDQPFRQMRFEIAEHRLAALA
jgi:hypothetical protein